MRSQVSNTGQSSGPPNDQKKSVFDRLGRQLDTGGRSMKRRPSPGQYGEYMPPPPPSGLHEADFGRYGPRDPHSQAELEWRYQNERRHMGGGGPYPRDGRHPGPMPPGPPPPLPPPHYEMEMDNGGRHPPYYPGPHPYHGGAPPGPPPPQPPPMGPSNMSMSMHQQRSSPKYDRHGNLTASGFKERGPMRGLGPLDHHPGMSPSRSFMPPGGPMMQPGPPHDIQAGMRPPVGMYPPHRWRDTMEPEFPLPPPPQMHPHAGGRGMMQEGRFSPADSRRYHQQQQQQQMLSSQQSGQRQDVTSGEAPRYTKWRERRDVITNLDKETAQSSSRTDSLKSTLQQPDSRIVAKSGLPIDEARHPRGSSSKQEKADAANRKEISSDPAIKKESSKTGKQANLKTEPQDISDGEIVDDEDSSDESETTRGPNNEIGKELHANIYLNRTKNPPTPYGGGRNRESHQYYESPSNKKRRLLEREDYSMDYETISDEDLDDFMGDKKVSDLSPDDSKLTARLAGDEGKSLSEIELLNALGLDWANLVEMAKQSKTTTSKDSYVPGSALPRFSIANYLPTLGITPELAGHELYDLVLKVCHP